MGDAPAAAGPKPCCVCDASGGKHCTKCKSRHYCSRACQLVDWNERGHKAQCKRLAAQFQDRLLDEIMPAKLKIKEAPPIVDDVAPAAGSRAAARLPASRTATTAVVRATALNDAKPGCRGTCAICLDLLPIENAAITFYECCCKMICRDCSDNCRQHDDRCPFCRTPPSKSNAEWVRRLLKHVHKGNAKAQVELGSLYHAGARGLKQSYKRAFHLYQLAAAQGHAIAQYNLGVCYDNGRGVKIDFKAAAQWYGRAAEQGHRRGQFKLGNHLYHGKGVAQSFEEAVRWYSLAAAQGWADALFNLGVCFANGHGVPQDLNEALRLFKRAAAKGSAGAAAKVAELEASIRNPS
jgi:TPR repeat protein